MEGIHLLTKHELANGLHTYHMYLDIVLQYINFPAHKHFLNATRYILQWLLYFYIMPCSLVSRHTIVRCAAKYGQRRCATEKCVIYSNQENAVFTHL